jgi:two-component system nitrogen regulation response regulator NtrX
VIISGHGNIETAVRATKLGAFDFIEKPLSIEKTVLTVRNALRQQKLELINADMAAALAKEYTMVGESVAMRALRKQISVVAPTDGRVLIYGEAGTGKNSSPTPFTRNRVVLPRRSSKSTQQRFPKS